MGSREARGRETGRLNSEPVRETESSERTGERQRERDRQTDRDRERQRKRQSYRQRQGKRNTENQAHLHTHTRRERQTDRDRERERINKPKLDVVPQPFSEPAIRSITRAITRVCAGKYWARILRVHYWQNVPNSCSPA